LDSSRRDPRDLNPENANHDHQTGLSGHFRCQLTAFLDSSDLKDIRWDFVFLCFLGLDAFAAKGASESLLEVFWLALRRLPPWIFFPSVAALTYLLFILLLSSLLAVRFMAKYYPVGPKLYHLIEASMVTDQEEATEEA
jgi:hypothetical protein